MGEYNTYWQRSPPLAGFSASAPDTSYSNAGTSNAGTVSEV